MELFGTIENDEKLLAIIAKSSILVMTWFLDLSDN